MESSTHRTEEEIHRQLEIRKQIQRLQAQLTPLPDGNDVTESPKRKHPSETLLAPATPSRSEYAPCILELLSNVR
jgi:minichromosome maintenance protein 10